MLDHLCSMLARRSDMLVHLLDDLATSHLAEHDQLGLALQPVSLATVAADLIAERRRTSEIPITADVAGDAVALADPVRTAQVLDNLVSNAVRYGGPHIRIVAVREGSVVRLSVSDDGSGVPHDLRNTLFDPYARGNDSPRLGGSGLGLLIVRQLCEAMNGTVAYDERQGTRFTVTLPAVPAVAAPTRPDVAPTGHSVAFWTAEDSLVEGLAAYVLHGLVAGEAVLVAATPAHRQLLDRALDACGIDLDAVAATGQYVVLDADELHRHLEHQHLIDRGRFEALISETVRRTHARWQTFRVYGEIVDLYWQRNDEHLAIDLEACWNTLREEVPFPLLCAYQLAPGQSAVALCDCHDMIVA